MWFIIISIICLTLFYFLRDVNKDNDDLQHEPLDKKFKVVVSMINSAAYNENGRITALEKRSFNLYQDGSNQIVNFRYGTGHLTITWKYKYFQKEVKHEKTFHDVRNLSIFEQQRIAETMISEMALVIQRHQNNVMNG